MQSSDASDSLLNFHTTSQSSQQSSASASTSAQQSSASASTSASLLNQSQQSSLRLSVSDSIPHQLPN